MSARMFTNGTVARESILDVIIPHGRKEEIDMNGLETLVESTIDSVHVSVKDKKVCIELTCAWEGKERKKITATGVEDFVADELRLSNIVDRVHCFAAADFQENISTITDNLFFLIRGKSPSSSDLEWEPLKEKLGMISSGMLTLLVVEPVYGVTIILLASEIQLEAIGSDAF
ncbi:hypothetical protein ACCC97_21245 [Variovorax sp. Varisp85]|uniref:hypothetical protein n=1 Tax=Variovorax sp. Varisp85 TaxID=3243059 RepID=UPI0039A4F88F